MGIKRFTPIMLRQITRIPPPPKAIKAKEATILERNDELDQVTRTVMMVSTARGP